MRSVEELYRGRTVRVFKLDRVGVTNRLREAAERLLAERADVIEVRLIGSLARGEARPGSDADIVISVRASDERFGDRAAFLQPYFANVGVGCDLLVYTQEELDRMRRDGVRIAAVLAEEGVSLAQRRR